MVKRGSVVFAVLLVGVYLLFGCSGLGPVKAEYELGRKNYEEAISLYKEYLSENPDSVRARSKLGFAYLKTGRLDEAVLELERVLGARPDEPYATFYLGMAYLNKEELDKTIEIWQSYKDKEHPLVEEEMRRLLTLVQIAESQRQAKKALAREQELSTVEPDDNTVAVCYYRDLSSDGSLRAFQKALAAMVITDLSKIESLNVVERTRVQALLAEMKLGQTGIVDQNTAPRIGRLLGAENLIIGSLAQGSIQAATTLASSRSESIKGTAATTVAVDEFYALSATIVRQVVQILGIELSPEEDAVLGVPHTTYYDAMIYYGKALDALDGGKWQDAKNFFDMALKIDPKFELAANGAAACPGASSPESGQLSSMSLGSLGAFVEAAMNTASEAQASTDAASEAGGAGGGGCGC